MNILRQVIIQSIPRLRVYFFSFLLAQLYGLQLLPFPESLITRNTSLRNLYLRTISRLRHRTPSDILCSLAFLSSLFVVLQRRPYYFFLTWPKAPTFVCSFFVYPAHVDDESELRLVLWFESLHESKCTINVLFYVC